LGDDTLRKRTDAHELCPNHLGAMTGHAAFKGSAKHLGGLIRKGCRDLRCLSFVPSEFEGIRCGLLLVASDLKAAMKFIDFLVNGLLQAVARRNAHDDRKNARSNDGGSETICSVQFGASFSPLPPQPYREISPTWCHAA